MQTRLVAEVPRGSTVPADSAQRIRQTRTEKLTFSAYWLWSSCIPDSSQWSLKPCKPIFLSSTVSS